MNRAAVLLAAAVLGSSAACTTTHCDNTTVNLYWVNFTTASGRVVRCSDPTSGVAGLQVFVDGVSQFQNLLPCQPFNDGVEGIGLQNFTFGSHTFEVRAFDANGNQIYGDSVTSTVPQTCNGAFQVDTHPVAVAGDFSISYSFTPNNVCASGTFVWYRLVDLTTNAIVSIVDGTHNPFSLPCGNPNPIPFASLPFGNYRLDFIETVQQTGNPSAPFSAVDQVCVPQAVSHAVASDSFQITIPAASSGALCP
jgi:hypothetical protein